MSAFSAAAQDEDGDIISALRAENEQLRQALLTANDTLVKASQAGARHARAAECLRKTVIRWAARAEQAEEMLEAIGAGGVGKLEQPQSVTDCHQSQPQGEPPGSTESAYQRGYLDGMAKGRRDAALDAAEQQPVAWLLRDANNHKVWFLEKTGTPTGYRGEWIKTPLYTHPQPKGEQEPVAYYVMNGAALFQLFRSKSQADALAYDLQKRHDLSGSLAHFHVVPLYIRPQPPRQPLTDAQINGHRLALPYNGEDLPDPWDFKQGARAAERAHGIGGDA